MDNGYDKTTGWQYMGALCANCALLLTFIGSLTHPLFPTQQLGLLLAVLFLLVMPLGDVIISQKLEVKNIRITLLGLLYITLPMGCMIYLRTHSFDGVGAQRYFSAPTAPGWTIPLLLIIFIWINDTMAYIVGSLIGRTPFSKISPKKTIEGTVGGMLLAVGAAGVFGYFWGSHILKLQHWLALAAIAAIAGTYGDLLESKLKRMAGVKDSGRIMPGHGGFLDRFDSLLLAAPFALLYCLFFMHNFAA